MATSMRGSASNAKEKRGTPSSSAIKKTPKPSSSTSSPSDEKTKTNKSVPNYLRHTSSSNNDPNKQPRRLSTDASASKPTYTRRASFDNRPPPTSQVQRVVRGINTGGATGSRDNKPQRSSTFSNTSTASSSSSTRQGSERPYARTSSLKDVKVEPNLPKSRSFKKSNLSASTKKEPMSNNRKKAPKSMTSKSSVGCENRHSTAQLLLDDDLVNLDVHEIQSLPEISEMPDIDEELADPINLKGEDGSKKITLKEFHHSDEENSLVVDLITEQTKLADPQPVDDIEDAGEQVNEGAENCQKEAQERVLHAEVVEEEKNNDENEPMEKVDKEEVEPTEEKDESQSVSSPVTESVIPTKPAQPSSAGKKDKQDYNNVIEETKTKLMGGTKRNKVLALAGAFETVISMQDSNKR